MGATPRKLLRKQAEVAVDRTSDFLVEKIFGVTARSLIQGVFEEVKRLAESYEVEFPKHILEEEHYDILDEYGEAMCENQITFREGNSTYVILTSFMGFRERTPFRDVPFAVCGAKGTVNLKMSEEIVQKATSDFKLAIELDGGIKFMQFSGNLKTPGLKVMKVKEATERFCNDTTMSLEVGKDEMLVVQCYQRKGKLYLAKPHCLSHCPVMDSFKNHLKQVYKVARRAPEALKADELNLMHIAYILYTAAADRDKNSQWHQAFLDLLKKVCGFPLYSQEYVEIGDIYPETIPKQEYRAKREPHTTIYTKCLPFI